MSSSASAVVDTPKGCTTPRLFTPPLRELTPDTSWGFECIDFLENMLGWVLRPWQRWLYIHALEKDESGTGFRFDTIIVLIARQNGKTLWLIGLALWRLYIDNAHLAIVAAQKLEYAEETLAEADAVIEGHPLLKAEWLKFSQTNGKHRIILKPIKRQPHETDDEYHRRRNRRRQWRAATASRRGGRSLSADLAMLDELREHQSWDAWDAIVPTTQAIARSLVIAASNAGDATSVVLRTVRDNAIERITAGRTQDTRTFLGEWSVPDGVDHRDETYWPMANPSMGYGGSTIERLRGRLENATEAGFRTENLCQWVDTIDPGIIPPDDWQATMDAESRRADGATVYAAVDVNFSRSRSYIAIAARREDGRLHVEVVEAKDGTDWVIPWFTDRLVKFEAVAVQARGAPASSLVEGLKNAGVPVVEWGGADLSRGCGQFFDGLLHRMIMHRPQPALDAGASTARAKPIGDAWAFDRKNSPNDVAPVVACAAAAWAEGRPDEKFVSAYEDEDYEDGLDLDEIDEARPVYPFGGGPDDDDYLL